MRKEARLEGWRPRLLMIVLLLGFWALSLRHLTITPPVYEDEPWQASTGWKLAREGVFGSDLFAGWNQMEQLYYGYMPLHPLLLAAVFKGAGVGLFQARFETVSLGLLTLALTYSLAVRLFGNKTLGLLAVLLLLTVRQTGRTPSQISGIVLLDIARIARYDMLVPVLGLAALQAMLAARRSRPGYALAGLLGGLAGLAHLYGLFWVPLLVLLALWQKPGRAGSKWSTRLANAGFLLLGTALPWIFYSLYVLADIPLWQAQTAGYAERFGLLDAGWYLRNLANEPRRYGPGFDEAGLAVLLRPGFWGFMLALPLSLLALWRRALAGDERARCLAVPATGLPLLFALLITLKLGNYLVAMVPLWAVVAAWGGMRAWQQWRRPALRLALATLFVAISVEGATRWLALEQAAAESTPYAAYIEQVRKQLPAAGARLVGLHHYWFGLEGYDYLSFVVPIMESQPEGYRSFGELLERLQPDALLLDRRMYDFLDEQPVAAEQLERWLTERGATMSRRVEDDTYGPMEIYLVPKRKG